MTQRATPAAEQTDARRPPPAGERARPRAPHTRPAPTSPTPTWRDVCAAELLQVGRGAAALLDGRQIALFRTEESVYAIDNLDPCSGAAVLSRGILGDRGGEPVIASPLHKQSFSLVTGQCLDEPDHKVEVFGARIAAGRVQVELR